MRPKDEIQKKLCEEREEKEHLAAATEYSVWFFLPENLQIVEVDLAQTKALPPRLSTANSFHANIPLISKEG